MTFAKPDAVDEMKRTLLDTAGTGDSSDEIGRPLDRGVETLLPEYDEKLELGLRPKPGEKRAEISGVHWGKVEREGARLSGLAAGLADIARCLKDGAAKIEDSWDGAAADAFQERVQQLVVGLTAYSASLHNAGRAVEETMRKTRELYGRGENGYRAFSERLFEFEGVPKPHEIHRLDGEKIDHIPLCGLGCHGEEPGQGEIYEIPMGFDPSVHGRRAVARAFASNHIATEKWYRWYGWEWTEGVDHEQDVGTVLRESQNQVSGIPMLVNFWYTATDAVKQTTSENYQSMLELLKKHTDAEMFRKLKQDMGA
ncbi:WXG100 family type VII secretion target [Lentzea sp. NPDC102401]|uniref:WXG100 family type VII secretion target n=1 Tax=Lentzea sp. NPDC102401 TaxID=3364128 RepID=UPI003816D423